MKSILILFITILMCVSCAKLDDLAPQNSVLVSAAVTDIASANAALNGVYDAMQIEDFDRWLSLAQYFSDETNATGTFPTRLEFGNLNVFPANTTMAVVFSSYYTAINAANNVIELIPLVEDDNFAEDSRNDIIGQAKFLRAQCYLNLVTLWKDVPLVLNPTKEVDEVLFVNKSSSAEIYDQIIADFSDAKAGIVAEAAQFDASKQSAEAFLARVALYQERWEDALNLADSVLGAGFDLTTVPYLDDQIYSLNYTSTDGNNLNFFYGPSDLGGRYSIGPSATIINAFEAGDLRFAASIDTASYSVPYSIKYPSFASAGNGTAPDPIFFIRHAEMVLVAAEAAAEMGDFDKANQYYNQVRSRAGLEAKELNAGNFVDLILQERFVEFAFEGSFRLIDLRRKDKAAEVLGPLGYDSPCDDVWPIPQRDVDRNPNLKQNDCCNC